MFIDLFNFISDHIEVAHSGGVLVVILTKAEMEALGEDSIVTAVAANLGNMDYNYSIQYDYQIGILRISAYMRKAA